MSSTDMMAGFPKAVLPPPSTHDHTVYVSVLQQAGKQDRATFGRTGARSASMNPAAEVVRMPLGRPVDPDEYLTKLAEVPGPRWRGQGGAAAKATAPANASTATTLHSARGHWISSSFLATGVLTTARVTPASSAHAHHVSKSTAVGTQQLHTPASMHAASRVYSNCGFPVKDSATTDAPVPAKYPAYINASSCTAPYDLKTRGAAVALTVANAGRGAHTWKAVATAAARDSFTSLTRWKASSMPHVSTHRQCSGS